MTEFFINKTLLIYPRTIGGTRGFVAEVNCKEAPVSLKSYLVVKVLNRLPEYFTKSAFIDISKENDISVSSAANLFNCFITKDIIKVKDSKQSGSWIRHEWLEAYKYHFATKDYPFIEMDRYETAKADNERMITYREEALPPSIYQKFDYLSEIKLDKLDGFNLEKYLDTSKVNIRKKLSFLFDVCFGERDKINLGVQGDFLRKSIPSGGARHTTEIFFIAFKGLGIEPGVYHYNVEENSLGCIKKGDYLSEYKDITFDLFSKFSENPKGLIIFTSLHERAMWRYRDSRSWRAILLDLGHALMITRYVIDKLGFKNYTYQKFKDRELCDHLGIDHLKQTPLFVSSIF